MPGVRAPLGREDVRRALEVLWVAVFCLAALWGGLIVSTLFIRNTARVVHWAWNL